MIWKCLFQVRALFQSSVANAKQLLDSDSVRKDSLIFMHWYETGERVSRQLSRIACAYYHLLCPYLPRCGHLGPRPCKRPEITLSWYRFPASLDISQKAVFTHDSCLKMCRSTKAMPAFTHSESLTNPVDIFFFFIQNNQNHFPRLLMKAVQWVHHQRHSSSFLMMHMLFVCWWTIMH